MAELLTIQSMRAPKPSKSVTSLVGRLKDLIKSGGSSVDVRELEEVIAAHSALARVAPSGCLIKRSAKLPTLQLNCILALRSANMSSSPGAARNVAAYKARAKSRF